VSLTLSALDRGIVADERIHLPNVSLVAAICGRCRMDVLVVRVGNERMPVQLEISQLTVVADSGRVTIGHPVHDPSTCAIREMHRRDQAEIVEDVRWERDGVIPERMRVPA
jgi:hypothetical protein